MMAYNLPQSFDVHIYNCHSDVCSHVVKQLADSFSYKCRCIAEYKINGLEKNWFLKYLKSSIFTVVHVCHKVNKLIASLPIDAAESMICVKFAGGNQDLTLHGDAAFSLSDFRQIDVSSPEDLNNFVTEVIKSIPKPQNGDHAMVQRRQKTVNAERPLSLYSSVDYPTGLSTDRPDAFFKTLEAILESQSHKAMPDKVDGSTFQILTNIFGNRPEAGSVFVTSQSKISVIKLSSLSTYEELTEAIDLQCGNSSPEAVSYIMHEKRSLTLLEMICLTKSAFSGSTSSSHNYDACILCTAQTKLIEFAKKLSSCIETSVKKETNLSVFHQTCNLLLLLQSQIDTSCYADGVYYSDGSREKQVLQEVYSSAISSKTRHGGASERNSPSQQLTSVLKILQDAKKKKKKDEKALPSLLLYVAEDEGYLKLQRLVGAEPHTQMMVLTECLRQIFIKKDPYLRNLELLHEYVKQTKRPEAIFMRMILRGLTHFLHYSIDRSKDMSKFCAKVMAIFEAIRKDGQNEVEQIASGLIFDSMPSIQHGIAKLCESQKGYQERLSSFAARELAKTLSPCLQIFQTFHERGGWLIVAGKFSNRPARVYVHFNGFNFERNEQQLTCTEYYLHMNQLSQLRDLGQHRGLVSLFAFSIQHSLQFYIIQDFNINLQQELKNRRQNQSLFGSLQLLAFIVQVAEAVAFLHAQGVIHRNLTASSLFATVGINDEKKVVLGCFKHSHKLESCHDIIKVCYYMRTRWAAPESLRRCCFSKASDVWMFGLLMYEVMTHGVLPYSDKSYGDEELVLKFYPQYSQGYGPQLSHEPCITSQIWSFIVDCTQFQSEDRPLMSNVAARLKYLLAQEKEASDPRTVVYPKIEEGSHQHSTTHSKGIPKLDAKRVYMCMQPQNETQISPIIKQYETDKVFIFQAAYKGPQGSIYLFSEDILRGVLEPLLPPIAMYSTQGTQSQIVIDCHLPKDQALGSFLNFCAQRDLAPSLISCIELCLQWAHTMQAIHERHYALTFFSAETMWVLEKDGKCTIVPLALSYLWHSSGEKSCQMGRPSDRSVLRKCSPELMSSGVVEEPSDVYSMGVLVYQVVQAFSSNYSADMDQSCGENIRSQILQNTNIEDLVPATLVQLIHSCVATDPCQRPKWPEIVYVLRSALKEMKENGLKKSQIPVTNPSVSSGDYSDCDTHFIGDAANPSEYASSVGSSVQAFSLDGVNSYAYHSTVITVTGSSWDGINVSAGVNTIEDDAEGIYSDPSDYIGSNHLHEMHTGDESNSSNRSLGKRHPSDPLPKLP